MARILRGLKGFPVPQIGGVGCFLPFVLSSGSLSGSPVAVCPFGAFIGLRSSVPSVGLPACGFPAFPVRYFQTWRKYARFCPFPWLVVRFLSLGVGLVGCNHFGGLWGLISVVILIACVPRQPIREEEPLNSCFSFAPVLAPVLVPLLLVSAFVPCLVCCSLYRKRNGLYVGRFSLCGGCWFLLNLS